MSQIHPSAVVDPSAQLGEGVSIGPFSIVEAGVQLGAGCQIGAHVTLGERLRLGPGCRVHNYACLGTASQDLKHRGQVSHAELGAGCIVREFVTVNRGTREGSVTRIGAGVVLMAYSHVAHECTVEDKVILVNGATLGGESYIERHAIIGGLSGIHQYCRVGAFTIIGANSKLTQDVPPFLIADGHPARPFGPNVIGLRRGGFGEAQIQQIRRIYRDLYGARTLEQSLDYIDQLYPGCELAAAVLAFCRLSRRGLIRPRQRRPLSGDTSEFSLG